MTKEIILTGIKPTGRPHLGNYISAIKPAKNISDNQLGLFFIADLHALNLVSDYKQLKKYIYEIAATYIACGVLNKDNAFIYKQSDIPAISELNTILCNFCPKGEMNRSHAYKDKVAKNQIDGKHIDQDINMGLYNYPILMASDILVMKTDSVPIGQDQIQHLEIAKDLAQKFNYSVNKNILKIPSYTLNKNQLIIGLDGRKMSKSYNNTITLFHETEKQLLKQVKRISTDSKEANEPKNPEELVLFELYKHFASESEILQFREDLIKGMNYDLAKKEVFRIINEEVKEYRKRYLSLINDTKEIDSYLEKGKELANKIANSNLKKIKKSLGLI